MDEELERHLGMVGGVARTAWFEGLGVDLQRRRRLIRAGELAPVRHGWIAMRGADPEAVAAVRAGGVLSCVSALERLGAWRQDADGAHLRFDRSPSSRPARCHVLPRRLGIPTETGLDRPAVALAAALGCLPEQDGVALADSCLRKRILTPEEVGAVGAELGGRARRIVERACPSAMSGTESRVRLMLRRMRVRFAPQASIVGVGDVDFLVGDRLVIEVDGRRCHLGKQFFTDRRRDAELVTMGFIVLRLSYWDVIDHPQQVEARILAIVRSRDHLWTQRNARWKALGRPCPVLPPSESGRF